MIVKQIEVRKTQSYDFNNITIGIVAELEDSDTYPETLLRAERLVDDAIGRRIDPKTWARHVLSDEENYSRSDINSARGILTQEAVRPIEDDFLF